MKQRAFQYHSVADLDEQVLMLMEAGVPVCERPYQQLAQSIALGEMALILRIQILSKENRLQKHLMVQRKARLIASHDTVLSHWDAQLMSLLKKGLPLSSRPYHILAKQTDLPIDEVLFRIERLMHQGYIDKIIPAV